MGKALIVQLTWLSRSAAVATAVAAKQISAFYCCTRVPNSVLPPPHNPLPAFAELRRRQPEIRSSGVLARFAVTKQLLHIADCTEDPSTNGVTATSSHSLTFAASVPFLARPCLRKVN